MNESNRFFYRGGRSSKEKKRENNLNKKNK